MLKKIKNDNTPLPGEVCCAFWMKGHDWMSSIIQWRTNGPGTHMAYVVDGKIYENFYPRARSRDFKPGERSTVELYRIEGSTPADWSRLMRWIQDEMKNPPSYSIRDLIRYMLNIRPVEGRQCFCSMWCLRGIRLKYRPELQLLARLQYPDYGSPADVRRSIRLTRLDFPKSYK